MKAFFHPPTLVFCLLSHVLIMVTSSWAHEDQRHSGPAYAEKIIKNNVKPFPRFYCERILSPQQNQNNGGYNYRSPDLITRMTQQFFAYLNEDPVEINWTHDETLNETQQVVDFLLIAPQLRAASQGKAGATSAFEIPNTVLIPQDDGQFGFVSVQIEGEDQILLVFGFGENNSYLLDHDNLRGQISTAEADDYYPKRQRNTTHRHRRKHGPPSLVVSNADGPIKPPPSTWKPPLLRSVPPRPALEAHQAKPRHLKGLPTNNNVVRPSASNQTPPVPKLVPPNMLHLPSDEQQQFSIPDSLSQELEKTRGNLHMIALELESKIRKYALLNRLHDRLDISTASQTFCPLLNQLGARIKLGACAQVQVRISTQDLRQYPETLPHLIELFFDLLPPYKGIVTGVVQKDHSQTASPP